MSLLTSDAARQAFDLSQSRRKLRERYGMHPWGQRALLARRLVEHGASFVTMVMENPIAPGQPIPKDVTYNWDSHAVNCHIFNDAQVRLPIYDRAITALIEDLYARGLDKQGAADRDRRVRPHAATSSYAEGRPGRDHWPQAMSMLVCGGGMRTGQVVGSTNAQGEHPKDRPLTPERPVGDDVPASGHRLHEHGVPRPPRPADADSAGRRADCGIVVRFRHANFQR